MFNFEEFSYSTRVPKRKNVYGHHWKDNLVECEKAFHECSQEKLTEDVKENGKWYGAPSDKFSVFLYFPKVFETESGEFLY